MDPNGRYHAIIPHVAELRVLLFAAEDGWTLPYVDGPNDFWCAAHISREMWERLGIETTARRCMAVSVPPASPQLAFVYLLENHSPTWQPPHGAQWIEREALDVLPLARPEHRPVLEEWFAWEASDGGPQRAPWYRVGWYDRACDWVREQLTVLGRDPTGVVEQLRSWQRSMVMRVATDGGTVYFKAVPPFFAHELTLARYLHARYPAHVPRVLAADDRRHWMLLEDVGPLTLADVPDISCYERALRLYAQLQIEQVGCVDQLLSLGCPDHRLDVLVSEMDGLLADAEAMLPGKPYGLSRAEVGALHDSAPRLKAMCGELSSFAVPCTLEHGDLWARQISVRDGCPVIMDWSDATLSHPFFSPGFFTDLDDDIFLTVEEAGRYLAGIPDARVRLLTAYLEPWTACEPMERLLVAYNLAQVLAGLHSALLYQRVILPGLEAKWEMERMVPQHLRKVLRHLAGLPR